MLAHLRVRDLVLIDELDLALSPGLNVLTGETGAGKSLVATAVDLLLGRRASGELVRRGGREAEVEGLFDISDEPAVRERLVEAGIPADDELLIRRVIPSSGRHKCYVNGRLASLSLLSHLAEGLARMTSQHEQHSLSDPAARLELLDGFGGLSEQREQMRARYEALRQEEATLEELSGRERDRAGRLDYLQYQLEEIDKADPKPDELELLDVEIDRMKNQELLSGTAERAALELYDDDGAIFERLGAVTGQLEIAARHDPVISGSIGELRDAAGLVEDAARFLRRYSGDFDSDPGRLEALEERRESLRSLTRKHGTDLAGLAGLREEMARELATLAHYDDALKEAGQAVTKAREAAEKLASDLSRHRRRAGRTLAKAVAAELRDLMFQAAGFEVKLEPSPKGLGSTGSDLAEFLVSLNPGEGAHPVQKVASGGELSRLMLAIKRALSGVGPVGTHIFDEVDSGIGGPVASSVGRKLKEVASHHQVICITHLPQIAGMADAHFFVSKAQEAGRTRTVIAQLKAPERVEEVSRMLAGDKVTDKTRAAAKELIL
jgi:DNA repair protein RecN (Recombination protein N)